MLYRTCKRMIEKGNTAGMATKLDVFYAANKLTEDEYNELTALLAEKTEKKEQVLTMEHERFIARRRARFDGIDGKVNIPYGTALTCQDVFLRTKTSVCVLLGARTAWTTLCRMMTVTAPARGAGRTHSAEP